jgi:penicillin-binding protein 1A
VKPNFALKSSFNEVRLSAHALWIGAAGLLLSSLLSLQLYATTLNEAAGELTLDTGPQASLVFDRDGQLVFSFASEERTDVALDRISPNLVAAVLTAEDRYFYGHIGLDAIRIGGAAWVNVKSGRIVQGASTITQQLVRLLALTRERTYARKWREALLALRIERRFTKPQILEAYLNRIYLGDGYFGGEAASRGYFGKSSSSLSNQEAALLAGLITCPSACSPRLKPERARARRVDAASVG